MQITADQYNFAKNRLTEIYDGKRDNGVGICSNVRGPISRSLGDWLMQGGWHYHTGDIGYPVPGNYHHMYFHSRLWTGQQKHLRMSLLRHMLKRLEQTEIV